MNQQEGRKIQKNRIDRRSFHTYKLHKIITKN